MEVFIFAFIGISLSSEAESHLLESNRVLALRHKLSDEFNIVHFLGNTHGLRVPVELAEDIKGSFEGKLHLLGVCGVVGTRQEVVAHALEVVLVGEVSQCGETLNFKKKINSLWLFIMVNELGDDLIHELVNFINRLISLNASLVIDSDLASDATEVLVTPANELSSGTKEAELKGFGIIFLLGSDHSKDTCKVSIFHLESKILVKSNS